MALSHVKSDTIADFTGTITGFDSQGSTLTRAATDLIRPSDWNSVHNEYYTLTGNTTVNSTASDTNVVFGASGGVLIAGSTASVVLSMPVLSAFQPFSLISGSVNSSHAPASWWFNKVSIPAPVTVSNIFFLNSVSANSPGGAGVTLSERYSMGLTIFKRVDFAANSTNLTTVTTASFALSASFSPVNNSWGLTVVTNTTGGTSTQAINSAAPPFTGNKFFAMPLVTSLSEGEYFFAHAHSTTTGTTASNTTLLSISRFYIAPQLVTMGSLGSAGSRAMSGVWEMGEGVASAVTTNNTMAMSVISQATRHWIYFHMANHATL